MDMIRKNLKAAWILLFVASALGTTGCTSVPDESALLDMTAKGERYVVTIVDYDRKNRIVSLYREFQGAKSVQTNSANFESRGKRRGDTIVGGAPLDMSELHPARKRQKAEFLRYDLEYYHHDGTQWIPIASPERFLKTREPSK